MIPGRRFTIPGSLLPYPGNLLKMGAKPSYSPGNQFKTGRSLPEKTGSHFTMPGIQITMPRNLFKIRSIDFTLSGNDITCPGNLFTVSGNDMDEATNLLPPTPCHLALPSSHVGRSGINLTYSGNQFTYTANENTFSGNFLRHETSHAEFNPLPVCRLHLQRYLSVIFQSVRMDCILNLKIRCHE